MKILIVKTSSLGDIVQAFFVLDALKGHIVDWVVEEKFLALVQSHPQIRKAIPITRKKILSSLKGVRQERYDVVFDLQGNCKSGIFTLAARALVKVGFGWRSVREWPNLLATHRHYDVSPALNMRLQYLALIEAYFNTHSDCSGEKPISYDECRSAEAQKKIKTAREFKTIMVCPGSKWKNKQLPAATWAQFLDQIGECTLLFVWGEESDRAFCEEIQRGVGRKSEICNKMTLSEWQQKMREVDLVLAVDSSALHLAGMVGTPSFGVFGPSSPDLFKPLGPEHGAYWGKCPYQRSFVKTCPVLRTCPTGSCMKEISVEELLEAFINFVAIISNNDHS